MIGGWSFWEGQLATPEALGITHKKIRQKSDGSAEVAAKMLLCLAATLPTDAGRTQANQAPGDDGGGFGDNRK